jgi:hypothetical protein
MIVFCSGRIMFQSGGVPLCLTRDLTPAGTGARNPCVAERSRPVVEFQSKPLSRVQMFFMSSTTLAFPLLGLVIQKHQHAQRYIFQQHRK